MKITSYHSRSCMEAWLICENLLTALKQHPISYSQRTLSLLDECANICLTTFEAIKEGWVNLSELAILCVGICEECAEVCDRYEDILFKTCADKCRACSTAFTPIAFDAV